MFQLIVVQDFDPLYIFSEISSLLLAFRRYKIMSWNMYNSGGFGGGRNQGNQGFRGGFNQVGPLKSSKHSRFFS